MYQSIKTHKLTRLEELQEMALHVLATAGVDVPEELRERIGIELRRQGLGSVLDAKVGDRPLPGVVVESAGGGVWWLTESE